MKRIGLDAFMLKIIALVTMVIDHVGAVLFPQYLMLRIIGRFSFPIYAFLIVEGFLHTRNVKKYMLRLGAFALLSEIPFDLATEGILLEFGHQNVFFTLAIGVVLLYLYERGVSPLEKWGSAILLMLAADLLRTDYGSGGLLMILCFYIFRNEKVKKNISVALINIFIFGYVQIFGTLALVPIAFYNGKKGISLKYFFYAVYPVHLLILYLINIMS